MPTELNLTYAEFLGLLLIYTAKSDNDFDISEKYMLTKKIDFEDISKAETILNKKDEEEVIQLIKKNYKLYSEDEIKKNQIKKDLNDIINCDGFIHETEQKILNLIDKIDSDRLN